LSVKVLHRAETERSNSIGLAKRRKLQGQATRLNIVPSNQPLLSVPSIIEVAFTSLEDMQPLESSTLWLEPWDLERLALREDMHLENSSLSS
jgi:hypothetical protein